MIIEQEHIKKLLDSLDTVLNSNSFLLELSVSESSEENTQEALADFMNSGEFKRQLLEQDALRGWNNYSDLRSAEIIKPNFEIHSKPVIKNGAIAHLRSMLTTEPNNFNFWSPYSKQLKPEQAEAIVSSFIWQLCESPEFDMYLINTDFSYNQVERKGSKKHLAYFEGDYGSDSATLIVRSDLTAYLLLTNGRD